MTKLTFLKYPLLLASILIQLLSGHSQALIIDHACTDITKIPAYWLNQAKSALRIHYAHTSHGGQITTGLQRLFDATSTYSYESANCEVPVTTTSLSLMDGQYHDGSCTAYITPELYWQGNAAMNITRLVLSSFDVNISLWSWCCQLDYYNDTQIQAYLDNMAQLESEYPDITFIYMTGNAQSGEDKMQNRYDRNEQIRAYCRQHNKILFDFADLDCWWNGEQHTVDGIPSEHTHYSGNEAGHTTFESCENKARAFWWLPARVAGWTPSATVLYIDPDGCGDQTPCYHTIQEALAAAEDGCEIRVAEETYYEAPALNITGTVTITGGWNDAFDQQVGATRMYAPVVPAGTVLRILPNVQVMPP